MENAPTPTGGQTEPQTIDQRESYAEAAFLRDIQKQRERYQIIMEDKRFIPEGAELVECYKTERGALVIMGDPESNDEGHDCDAMGCGSLSHVIARVEPDAPDLLRELEVVVALSREFYTATVIRTGPDPTEDEVWRFIQARDEFRDALKSLDETVNSRQRRGLADAVMEENGQ